MKCYCGNKAIIIINNYYVCERCINKINVSHDKDLKNEIVNRVVLPDYPTYPLVLCNKGKEFLFNTFWKKVFPEDFISIIQLKKNISHTLNYGTLSCPKCDSKETNEYKDAFVCFACKFRVLYDEILKRQKEFLLIENGYFAKSNVSKNLFILFFHRELIKDKIKDIANKMKIPEWDLEVHHINQNKKDNRLTNLEILTSEEHEKIHEDLSLRKAFSTWCSKVHGYIDSCYFNDFLEWKLNKEEDGDG